MVRKYLHSILPQAIRMRNHWQISFEFYGSENAKIQFDFPFPLINMQEAWSPQQKLLSWHTHPCRRFRIIWETGIQSQDWILNDFAPRNFFLLAIGMNYFMENSQRCGARKIAFGQKSWSNFEPKSDKSFDASYPLPNFQGCRFNRVRIHSICDSNSPSKHLLPWWTYAIFTTPIHWWSIALTHLDFSGQNRPEITQLVLQKKTGVTATVDPWGGSYYGGNIWQINLVATRLVRWWRSGRVGWPWQKQLRLTSKDSDRRRLCQKNRQEIDSGKMWSVRKSSRSVGWRNPL